MMIMIPVCHSGYLKICTGFQKDSFKQSSCDSMKSPKVITADAITQFINSGDHVFIQGGAAAPQALIGGLAKIAGKKDVKLYHLHLNGLFPLADETFRGIFSDNSFFMGENVRQAVQEHRADYIPVSLAELPILLRKRVVPLDVALVSVSLPDKHGFVSLGTSVDISLAAVQSAKIVIAQVNKYMPRTFGDGVLHLRDLDYIVEADIPVPEAGYPDPSPEEMAIGKLVAGLVPDGATLQMGIGSMPNAVLSCLTGHKDLGVHTEMFSDGLLPLLDSGVVNNRFKKVLPGRTVTSFAVGSQNLYQYADDNLALIFKEISWVNDPVIIARNPRVVAINSAIEVDLTGQVCADSIGRRMLSGVGGQMDFMLGAAHSQHGIPIIAMCSRTNKGVSKIAPTLRLGAGVTVTRAQAHWIVTEYGAVDLYGKNLGERARLLISIAHPDDRQMLEESVWEKKSVAV